MPPSIRVNALLDSGLVKEIFDHVRNYLMCAFLLAVGVLAFKDKTGLFFGQVANANHNFSGLAIIGLSCILFGLNLLDGIRRIRRFGYGRLFSVVFTVGYVVLSIRMLELAWYLRLT
jgi:hypothetical protein